MARLKFSVGSQSLRAKSMPWEAGYTRDIREAMQKIIKNYGTTVRAIKAESLPALKFALNPIYRKSQQLVPVRSGRLKRSGFIMARMTAFGPQGVVGYARAGSPDYAVLQHENLEFRHAGNTQAKYLEVAVQAHIGSIGRRYAQHLKQNLGL